jgi:hypothetical protein
VGLSQFRLVLVSIALIVAFAIGWSFGRITAIRGAQGDFQIHDSSGQVFIFNRKTGQLWRQFLEYNYGRPIAGLQSVPYYDAKASDTLQEELGTEKAKHLNLSNLSDQPAKPRIDFQPVAMPSVSSSTVPKAKPVQP